MPSSYPSLVTFGGVGLDDLFHQERWVKFFEWSKEFNSDIIHVRVFGSSVIVLNSLKAANDLLSARSMLYSDSSVMLNELLGRAPLLSLTDPDNFVHHIEYPLAASILSVTYGVDVRPEEDDPNIERADKASANFSDAAISGIFLVDILSFLKHVPSWMPGAGFKRFAEKSLPNTLDMMNTPFHEGYARIQDGKSEPSFLSCSLTKGSYSINNHTNAELIKDVAAIAYVAGLDSLRSRVCLRAVMLEVLRWQAVFPLDKSKYHTFPVLLTNGLQPSPTDSQ
ncbi:Cytochrome P450 superfamily protein [Pleurotus pulmonarius]